MRAVIRRAAPVAVAPAAEAPAQDEPEMGSLTVVCVPACDEVLDGGRSLGPSPVFKVPAAAGAHTLTLQADDDRKSVTVTVKPDQVSYVRVEFP
jgi:serine/threonine-protein kinase